MGESGLGYGWTSQRLWEPERATGGETETERGRWGRRIFYQQNSRTASGWSLETSSSGAWGQLWAPFSSLLAISPLGPAWGRGALLALTPLDTHTHHESSWQLCPSLPSWPCSVCEMGCAHLQGCGVWMHMCPCEAVTWQKVWEHVHSSVNVSVHISKECVCTCERDGHMYAQWENVLMPKWAREHRTYACAEHTRVHVEDGHWEGMNWTWELVTAWVSVSLGILNQMADLGG